MVHNIVVFTLNVCTIHRCATLTHLAAASRCALRTSGFWLRFFLISSSEAPTIARLSFVVLRVLVVSLFHFVCAVAAALKKRAKVNKYRVLVSWTDRRVWGDDIAVLWSSKKRTRGCNRNSSNSSTSR